MKLHRLRMKNLRCFKEEVCIDFDNIRHYQKIIVALSHTDRIMKEIDKAWKK